MKGLFIAGMGMFMILAVVVHIFGSAFLIMLALGGLHSVWPQIPALGYWVTVVLAVALSSIAALLKK